MMLFVFTMATNLLTFGSGCTMADNAMIIACLIIVSYIAGRLDKIEKNRVLISLVLVILFVDAVVYAVSNNLQTFIDLSISFGLVIEWFTISCAYFVRYKEHKEAGLSDAPKAK